MTSISAFEFFVQLRDWWEKKDFSAKHVHSCRRSYVYFHHQFVFPLACSFVGLNNQIFFQEKSCLLLFCRAGDCLDDPVDFSLPHKGFYQAVYLILVTVFWDSAHFSME